MVRIARVLALLAGAGVLAGCSKGLDRTPDFSSVEKYHARTEEISKEITQPEAEAFTWAVSDQTLDTLKSKYPGKTFRQIAQAELDFEIQSDKAKLAQLEKLRPVFDPLLSELQKIKAETSEAQTVKDSFMSDGFSFKAKINNDSKLDFSTLTWRASLTLDNSKDVVATSELHDVYESDGGLKAGTTVVRVLRPDTFFKKDWVTLAVKNAKVRRVALELLDANDFNNKSYLEGAPYASINKIATALRTAEQHKAVIDK